MACVPVHDTAGVGLNGCVGGGGGGIEPAQEYRGQARPAFLGGVLSGWFMDRHRPTEPLNIEVRAYTYDCDPGYKEAIVATAVTNAPDHLFTVQLPPSLRICDTLSQVGTVQGFVIRTPSRDDRPEEARPELFRYVGGGCVQTPDTITTAGLCPAGTGANGGFHQCDTNPAILTPYCGPGLTGQPVMPTAPTGLSATGGANQVTLTWQPNGAIEYRIYEFNGGAYTFAHTSSASSYSLTGLANGTTHTYAVSAANSIGESPLSAPVAATTAHCSQVCTTGCCTGETCNSATVSNGCVMGGKTCGAPCAAGLDVCEGDGYCGCHQSLGTACDLKNCGTVRNVCGGTYNCGTCTPPYYCSGGVMADCVCTPIPKSTACAGLGCGTSAPDGCGGTYLCSACPTGSTCGKCESGRCYSSTRLCP